MIISIAMHDAVAIDGGNAREAVRERAREAGFNHVHFVDFRSAIEFLDKATAKGGQPIDLAVIPYDLPGLSAIQAVTEARASQPYLYTIVIDDTSAHAAEACKAEIDDYLVNPVNSTSFYRALERALLATSELYENSLLLSVREGIRRVAFHDIVFVETSGHDQLLHLRDGRLLTGRYSSQALFELLAADRRFFKVGSSYIVNLHEVSRLHTPSGELVLLDGTTITVPQRLRKGLEGTLLAYRGKEK